MKKKIIIFFLFFIISLQVFAFVPVIVGASRLAPIVLKTPAGNAAIQAVLALGAGILGVVASLTDPAGNSHDMTINTTNAPIQPSAIEAAEGFTAGFPKTLPANSVDSGITYNCSPGITSYPDASSCALGAYNASSFPSAGGWRYDSYYIDANKRVNVTVRETTPGYEYSTSILAAGYEVQGCRAGYTLNSTSGGCTLSNADAVIRPSDGHCPIVRSGNAYSVAVGDPDCAVGGANPQFSPDGTIEISDATGHSFKWQSTTKPGEHILSESVPSVDGSGNPTTKTYTKTIQDSLDPSQPSELTGQTNSEHIGQGDNLTTQEPAPTFDDSRIVNAINAQTNLDASRETARRAKEDADREIPTTSEMIPKLAIPVTFAGVNFSSSAVCPAPIAFDMLGQHYAIAYDPMCNLMSLMRPLFLALGAFSAAFIFMGAFKV